MRPAALLLGDGGITTAMPTIDCRPGKLIDAGVIPIPEGGMIVDVPVVRLDAVEHPRATRALNGGEADFGTGCCPHRPSVPASGGAGFTNPGGICRMDAADGILRQEHASLPLVPSDLLSAPVPRDGSDNEPSDSASMRARGDAE